MRFLCSIFLFVGILNAQTSTRFSIENLQIGKDCQNNLLIVKTKDLGSIQKIKHDLSKRFPQTIVSVEQLFKNAKGSKEGKNALGQDFVNLTTIYQLELSGTFDLWDVYRFISKSKNIWYVEPKFIHQTTFTPNDPNIVLQWQIGKIQAEQAWDIQQGDSAFVVGIIDTGTDITHADLTGNSKVNTTELIDGIDNDGDGYIDNRNGWDFIDNDNNPDAQSSNSGHGVQVAGCAAASTNNGIGVSGPAFKGKFLPIRVGSGSSVSFGYEGIVYAADHGCKFINCSWGGEFPSLFDEDIINYATINMGSLVIGGAGNNGVETPFYPAAYDRVLSVASTSNNDQKSGFSNYGTWVDISAPGSNIYTTSYGNTYATTSGTSFSSPITAGAAALVNAQFPSYSPIQIGALLKATASNINSQNPSYIGKLGTGRLNLYQAVQNSNPQPFVELDSYILTDYQGDVFSPSDTAELRVSFINYLSPTGSTTASISSTSPYVSFLNNNIPYGVIGTMAMANNNSTPWEIKISNIAPLNTIVSLTITLTDGSYSSTHTIDMTINREYINVTANEIGVTITSKGGIGFNDFTAQQQGIGFVYPYTNSGSNLLYEGGFMVGTSNEVSDIVRTGAGGNDLDFFTLNYVSRNINGFSDFDVNTRYNDQSALNDLPVEVIQNTYAWDSVGHEKYVMMEYYIINSGATTLSGIHAGIYCDWDIEDYTLNIAETDGTNNLGYVFYDDGTTSMYAGARLLYPSTGFSHYGFDHSTGGAGGIDITDDYTSSEKFISLSTARNSAGGAGNDVSNVVGAGPFTILAGDTQRVVFALLAGDNLTEFVATSDSAASHFNSGVITKLPQPSSNLDIFIYPNPSNDIQRIVRSNAQQSRLEIYDINGRLQQTQLLVSQDQIIDISALASGVYTYRIISSESVTQHKVVKF